jgi:hypothetical protein
MLLSIINICLIVIILYFGMRLRNRIIFNERFLSSIFIDFVRLKYRYYEELNKDLIKTESDRTKMIDECRYEIYKVLIDNIQDDCGGFIGLRKAIDKIDKMINKSKINWLNDFVLYCYSTISDTEKIIKNNSLK